MIIFADDSYLSVNLEQAMEVQRRNCLEDKSFVQKKLINFFCTYWGFPKQYILTSSIFRYARRFICLFLFRIGYCCNIVVAT